MKKYYLESKEETLKEIQSNENGLTNQEALEREQKYGKNKLAEGKKTTLIERFISSIKDPMIIMLLAAALISGATTLYQNIALQAHESYADIIIILAVVTINTILGVIQESKAEEAIDALKEMTAATSKVLRDGKQIVVKSEDLTIGDVLILEAGDAVGADCRILESYSMKVEEAALTGESVPVDKIMDIINLKENSLDIALGDRKNMLYAGSTVVYGRGKAVVVAIGMDSEMGKIASALATTEVEQTPLQKKMAELSKVLTKLCLGICGFIFVFGVVRAIFFSNQSIDLFSVILDTFIIAVALAVAAIPEGLPAVVTIVLSIGVTAMSKRNALIRKLTAVETLGCTQIICSDKTGTLTQNKMTVVDTVSTDNQLLAQGMALCSDAKIDPQTNQAIGEPTEAGLVNYANSLNLPSYQLDQQYPRVGEAPFDSNRKMMSVVVKYNGKYRQYTKGANEIILEHCIKYLTNDGRIEKMNQQFFDEKKKQAKSFADRALRVLGLAYRDYDEMPNDFTDTVLEKDLTYIGFTGMIDPCREEVYPAIKQCAASGIRPIMITGDHIDTAVAIGKDLGIINDASQAHLGSDLDGLTDEEMVEIVKTTSVFARVQPEHKTRIVKTLKSMGYIVAMTGDGVNDAPSIKAADIGIGMGITGTDVTKSVADMVLADDNFATIVNAVEEGRKIYDNVRKVIQFQLSTNMSEVIVIFISSLLGVNMISAAQLLYINMVTDSAPGLALGMEKAEKDLMNRKPRSSSESIFAHGTAIDMVAQGILMAAIIIVSFFTGYYMENGFIDFQDILTNGTADGMTMAFITCNFIEMFHAICMRSRKGSIFTIKNRNWWLVGALALTVTLSLIVIYVPTIANVFELTTISLQELLVSAALALSIIPLIEIYKFFYRLFRKKHVKK